MDWHIVEEKINQEIEFLKNNLQASPFSQNDAIKCIDCLIRYMAIFVVSGKIKIIKVNYKDDSLWSKSSMSDVVNDDKKHGKSWHDSKIKLIKKYFESNNILTEDETPLFYGRCDLSVPSLKIFIEVGTINFYKLYLNLFNMTDCKILIILSDDSLLEIKL